MSRPPSSRALPRALACLLIAIAALGPCASAQTREQTREDARLITAREVLEELRAAPDQNVPDWLMQRAYGIAVVPEVIKGALMFGGRYGSGVLTVRDAGGRFSNPIFITLAGGSFGWQVGATSTDVVLVFVTQRSIENFARGKFTLGADASVAAGPLGRQGEAEAGVNAEICSYSRSRGLFAGVALDGTVLAFDRSANRAYYSDPGVSTETITSGKDTTTSESARRFLAAIAQSAYPPGAAPPEPGAAAAPPSAPPAAPPPVSAAPPSPAPPGAAPAATHSFPLEDSQPGREPR
jgi:lipid-binding SYLF domain-containing protein